MSNLSFDATWAPDTVQHRAAQFTLLPRGTYRAKINNREIDVWRINGAWHWTILDSISGRYLARGNAYTLAEAQKATLKACGVNE